MNKRSAAKNGTARSSGSYAKCGQMSKTVLNGNHASLRAQNNDSKGRQGQGFEPRVRPLSTVSPSNVTPHSHQRRWSVDCGSPPVIIVVKNKKEPQPPQRSVSLLQPHTGSHSSFKRYSCPPIGSLTSPSQSSSSSSSTTSSCSSPPPVKTSVITGPDPLGWKLRPKSTSAHARTKRLSLQIPIPVIPEPKTPSPEPLPKSKPPLMPKPFRRRHSESSAFLISLRKPLPVVTLQELCTVNLRPVTLSDGPDDVFSEGTREEKSSPSQPCKIPPPVPEKTAMARQIAQLIAKSHQRCKHVPARSNEEEHIYTTMRKAVPKYSQETVDHNSTHTTKTAGLNRDVRCDRKRSTPHFPG